VGLPSIKVHDWEVCQKESGITVSSRCPDTFDQIVYVIMTDMNLAHSVKDHLQCYMETVMFVPVERERVKTIMQLQRSILKFIFN
jgi:hypothetical protein